MAEISGQIDEWIAAKDPFDYRWTDVQSAQVHGANEVFQKLRQGISVLDKLAQDVGIDEVAGLQDLVPLSISHESYKSYPAALITQQKWEFLSRWLESLVSVKGISDVDMGGVTTVDQWLDRLRVAGLRVYGSSGTSGKSSLFALSGEDHKMAERLHYSDFAWGPHVTPGAGLPCFILTPSHGFYRGIDDIGTVTTQLGRQDAVYWMSGQPLLLSEINQMGELRKAIADGTARPADLTAFNDAAQTRSRQVTQDLERLVDHLLEHQSEPVLVWGGWAQQYRLTELLRSRGLCEGFLHPGSVVHIAGGNKGVDLPPDVQDLVRSFWGLEESRYLIRYGCSEIVGLLPMCQRGRYHMGPWIIPMVLDKAGETLLSASGSRCIGRMAFMDLTSGGRWGGVITGDRVSFDPGPCGCGRAGPSVADISRYMDLDEGEEKLSCAGTIESYVRGMLPG